MSLVQQIWEQNTLKDSTPSHSVIKNTLFSFENNDWVAHMPPKYNVQGKN